MSAVRNDLNLEVTRVFDAPVALVWKMWTRPEHLVHWWKPNGFNEGRIESLDVRPGGKWRIYMQRKAEEGETQDARQRLDRLRLRCHSPTEGFPAREEGHVGEAPRGFGDRFADRHMPCSATGRGGCPSRAASRSSRVPRR